MSTSATGGTLTTTLPNQVALRRLLQGLLAGVMQLPGNMVRPRWQPKPPPMPAPEVNWAAFGISRRTGDPTIYVEQSELSAQVVRQEQLEILVSAYGPDAEGYCELFRDGMEVAQNREPMLLAGLGLVEITPAIHVPEIHAEQWYNRCDFTWTVNRETSKQYQILCFTGALGAIITETMTLPYEVTNP